MFGVVLLVCLGAKKRLNFIDALPFLCMAIWTTLVLVMPANQYGNLDEFHHRPFHVVYYIFVIWLSGRSSRLLFEKLERMETKRDHSRPKTQDSAITDRCFTIICSVVFRKRRVEHWPMR